MSDSGLMGSEFPVLTWFTAFPTDDTCILENYLRAHGLQHRNWGYIFVVG